MGDGKIWLLTKQKQAGQSNVINTLNFSHKMCLYVLGLFTDAVSTADDGANRSSDEKGI
jgi:hypothetical protein